MLDVSAGKYSNLRLAVSQNAELEKKPGVIEYCELVGRNQTARTSLSGSSLPDDALASFT